MVQPKKITTRMLAIKQQEIDRSVAKINAALDEAEKYGTGVRFSDYVTERTYDDVRKMFEDAGYKISRNGYLHW